MRAVYTVFTCPWLTAPRPASHPHDSVIAWMVEPPAVLTKGGNLDLTRSQLARRPIVGCWTIFNSQAPTDDEPTAYVVDRNRP